ATVASVAITPIRRVRVACTAAWASGVITPISGTSNSRCRSGSAAAVAELHATTSSLTSRAARWLAISCAYRLITSGGLVPYGKRAGSESPKYRKSSLGNDTRHSCRTVSPPTPESNTPIGRGSIHRSLERAAAGRRAGQGRQIPVRSYKNVDDHLTATQGRAAPPRAAGGDAAADRPRRPGRRHPSGAGRRGRRAPCHHDVLLQLEDRAAAGGAVAGRPRGCRPGGERPRVARGSRGGHAGTAGRRARPQPRDVPARS